MRTSLFIATLGLLLPAAVRADSTVEACRAQLISADKAFCANAARLGVYKAFMAVATDDMKLLSESGRGFDAVRSGYRDMSPTATLTWQPSQAEVSAAGDLGYTWGSYEYRDRTAAGKPVVETGAYVTIWRRQADGSWKVVLDGGEADHKAS